MMTDHKEVMTMSDEKQRGTPATAGKSYSIGNVGAGAAVAQGDHARAIAMSSGSGGGAELAELFAQLNEALKQLPAEQKDSVEYIAEEAQALHEEAQKETANPVKVKSKLQALKAAAENIATVMPIVMTIAKMIVPMP